MQCYAQDMSEIRRLAISAPINMYYQKLLLLYDRLSASYLVITEMFDAESGGQSHQTSVSTMSVITDPADSERETSPYPTTRIIKDPIYDISALASISLSLDHAF